MEHSAEFRRCLLELDVEGIKLLWAHVNPHLHQPTSPYEALAMLHRARTEAQSIPFRLRAYSHSWLMDNCIPSALPDELRPKAERMYPRLAPAVGISINFSSTYLKPAGKIVQDAMGVSVEEQIADGEKDHDKIKARMMGVYDKTMDKLFGRYDNVKDLTGK